MSEGQSGDQQIVVQYRDAPAVDETAARNRQTLLDALDQFMAGNADDFWSIFDQDVVFHEAACLPYGGAHKGLAATKRAFARMSATFESLQAVFEAVLASRDIVILYQSITFRVKENGNTGTLPVAEMYRFRGGKVIEWRALYFDANMVAQAIAGDRA